VGVRCRPRNDDTAVSIVVVGPNGIHRERRQVFLGGANGRSRAGLTAAAVLLAQLRTGSSGNGALAGAETREEISAARPAPAPRGRGRRCSPGRAGSDGHR
jgi:hypothetical protein